MPTMSKVLKISRDCSWSQRSKATSVERTPHPPKPSFFDLPEDVRYLVCVQAQALTNELDRLMANRGVRASTVYRVGCEIANLSSICCLVREMLDGERQWAVPTIDEIQHHSRALDLDKDGCPCCSAERLLDLDRDVLGSSRGGDEDSSVQTSVQEFALNALNALVREAEKVLGTLDGLMAGEDHAEPFVLTRASSLHRVSHSVSSRFRQLLRRIKMFRLAEWRRRLAKQRVTFQMVTRTVTVTA